MSCAIQCLNLAPQMQPQFQITESSLNRTYRELRHLAARVILELSSILALSHMVESIKASLSQNMFDYASVMQDCHAVQVNAKYKAESRTSQTVQALMYK